MDGETDAPRQAARRIEAAQELLLLATRTQSLLRVHDLLGRADRQLEGAKAILRAASGPGLAPGQAGTY